MLDRILFDWNQVAGVVTAAFVNAFPASVLLVSVAWVLVLVQKSWTAASRHWVWWIVLASLALLPLAHALLPEQTKLVQTETRNRDATAKHLSTLNLDSSAALTPDPVSRIENPRPSSKLTISGIFLLVWVAVVAFQLARLVLAFRNTMSLKRSAMRPGAELQRKWREHLEVCRLRRPVMLGLSRDIASPAAAGYSRPLILLPVSVVNSLTSDELDPILLHELAHIRRCDDWAITVQRFVEALLVLHPLVSLVTKKIELEREIACDDWVLLTQRPQAYASCLTKLAEFCAIGRPPRLTTAAIEHQSQLSQRVEMLLDRTRSIATRPSLRGLGSLAMIMVVLAFVSLRLPPLMAYPKSQSPAPPQAPAAPQAPAVPESHPAKQLPPSPPTPEPPAPPTAPDDVDSIVIYSDDGHSYMYGNYSGSDHVFAHPGSNKSGAIEFHRNGKSYIIRDPATVHAAQEILRPQEDLGRRQAELGEQQGKLGEEQAKLGATQAKLSDEQLNRETIEKLKRDLKRVEDEISHINIEETMKTASEAQDRLGELQAEIGELQAEMGEQHSEEGVRQGNLGQQQGQLGEQQSRLGAMQAKLGEEQSRAAKEAREKLNKLLDRAVANGLAKPAP